MPRANTSLTEALRSIIRITQEVDDKTNPNLLASMIATKALNTLDEHNADIYPVGSRPDPDRVLANIVFRNPAAVTRIIGQLIEMLDEKFGQKYSLVEAGEMKAYVSEAMAGTIHPFVSYDEKHPDVGQWIVVIDKGGWPFVGQFNLDTGLDDYRCLHRLTGRYTYGWKWWAPISDFPGPIGTAKGNRP